MAIAALTIFVTGIKWCKVFFAIYSEYNKNHGKIRTLLLSANSIFQHHVYIIVMDYDQYSHFNHFIIIPSPSAV